MCITHNGDTLKHIALVDCRVLADISATDHRLYENITILKINSNLTKKSSLFFNFLIKILLLSISSYF